MSANLKGQKGLTHGHFPGTRAAQILAQELPKGWRVVLIDRNTHFNHLYVLPRYVILPQHAQKAFIPYTNIFRGPAATEDEDTSDPQRQVLLHAQVTSMPLGVQCMGCRMGSKDPINDDSFIQHMGSQGLDLMLDIAMWVRMGRVMLQDRASSMYANTNNEQVYL